ncbi:dynamin family protein [Avibacterium sp. 20-15]|uniref:dynamin family protein n=1 Tax=unclassified Avibacterium TaxID=2685287 RepID=UPI00202720C6|nr:MULTISPECIES: dynamin family protein [unclassified Avibacterium]MCW9733544.1 dynamin family protein [Avibacterium sp. 20-15]URL03402.1 dynamin family protein [Avibacterium sp. 20-132]
MKRNLFEVIVVGTMSAGKSTFINALIGTELLHSANQATTATITRIHDKDNKSFFSGSAYNYDGKLVEKSRNINAEILKKWNKAPEIKKINIDGDIQTIKNTRAELVIYDLPGPNNSQNDNHELLTMEVINDKEYGLILYLLNATQFGINDDRLLLEKIYNTIKQDTKKEIIFILNKADEIDTEKELSIVQLIKNVEKYLNEIGFKFPNIITISAKQALLFQKLLNSDVFSRSEKYDLSVLLESPEFLFKGASSLSRKNRKLAQSFIQTNLSQEDNEILANNKSIKEIKEYYYNTGFGEICYLLQNKIDHTFNKIKKV